MNAAQTIGVLIPAYNPGERLISLVDELVASRVAPIIIVDDGSVLCCSSVFERLKKIKSVVLLQHATNIGKGAALKTGLNHAYVNFPDHIGIVTADADGQHAVEDILSVGQALSQHPGHLSLGSRVFDTTVPFRSKMGNYVTKKLFKWIVGQTLVDTQSGLRGIPRKFIPTFLKLTTNGYEFELDMLIACKRHHFPIAETRIATIYLDKNRGSHFRPITDSFKIYCVLFRHCVLSMTTRAINYLVGSGA